MQEDFIYAPGTDTDLLFVEDTDGVMGTLHTSKGSLALPTLIEVLEEGNIDLHASAVHNVGRCPVGNPAWVTSSHLFDTQVDSLSETFETQAGSGSDQLLVHAGDEV